MNTLTIEQNEYSLQQFIIEVKLVEPLTKIIDGLKSGSFRDCDIKWLDDKLEGFIVLAAETLGLKNIIKPSQLGKEPFTILNEHNIKYYLTKFNALLSYFKTL